MNLPHATSVILTHPDGWEFEGLLSRYDGPHGAYAAVYVQPDEAMNKNINPYEDLYLVKDEEYGGEVLGQPVYKIRYNML